MSKPRITADSESPSFLMSCYTNRDARETPSGQISISYDHDDAVAALKMLDRLVEDVRVQIERTRKDAV